MPLIPVAIDGAFDAWPRSRLLPAPTPIHVQFGPALQPAELAAMNDEQMVAEAGRRIEACQARAREYRQRILPIPQVCSERQLTNIARPPFPPSGQALEGYETRELHRCPIYSLELDLLSEDSSGRCSVGCFDGISDSPVVDKG